MKKSDCLNKIKNDFFDCYFSWCDYGDGFPGMYVPKIIKQYKIEVNIIYEWLNEYINSNRIIAISDQLYTLVRIRDIVKIYNFGLTKDSILSIYSYLINLDINRESFFIYIDCLFGLTSGIGKDNYVCTGIIPYLDFYNLSNASEELSIKLEKLCNEFDYEKDKKIMINEYAKNIINNDDFKYIANSIYLDIENSENRKFNQINNLLKDFKFYRNFLRYEHNYLHFEKSYSLLQIIYKFDEEKLSTDIKTNCCNYSIK